MLIKCSSNMLTTAGLVNAEVVDIQCLDIRQDVVIYRLLYDAEAIALDEAVPVFGNEHGAGIISEYLQQLGIGILASDLEYVRASVMMDQIHLV